MSVLLSKISMILFLVVMNQLLLSSLGPVLCAISVLDSGGGIAIGRSPTRSNLGRPINLEQALRGSSRNQRDYEDHSNIELDKLLEANKYQILLPTLENQMQQQQQQRNDLSLAKLLARYSLFNSKSRDFLRNQMDRKRSLRDNSLREDKDYSFVSVEPHDATIWEICCSHQTQAQQQQQQQQIQQQLQWPAPKLRDSKLEPTSKFVDADGTNLQGGNYYLDQQLLQQPQFQRQTMRQQQQQQRLFPVNGDEVNNIEAITDDIVPKVREKKRRCKMDPNLGVKNPSYCDTDAYFGAADYSMRDVWDSAGR